MIHWKIVTVKIEHCSKSEHSNVLNLKIKIQILWKLSQSCENFSSLKVLWWNGENQMIKFETVRIVSNGHCKIGLDQFKPFKPFNFQDHCSNSQCQLQTVSSRLWIQVDSFWSRTINFEINLHIKNMNRGVTTKDFN